MEKTTSTNVDAFAWNNSKIRDSVYQYLKEQLLKEGVIESTITYSMQRVSSSCCHKQLKVTARGSTN